MRSKKQKVVAACDYSMSRHKRIPEILIGAFNYCLREGRFFVDWKKQRLVLLRKGNKPLGDASSYRPICLLDTMGKLLEE